MKNELCYVTETLSEVLMMLVDSTFRDLSILVKGFKRFLLEIQKTNLFSKKHKIFSTPKLSNIGDWFFFLKIKKQYCQQLYKTNVKIDTK